MTQKDNAIELNIDDLTICAKSQIEIYKQIEDKWGLLLNKHEFKEIYRFENLMGLTIYMNFSESQISLIEQRSDSTFISYRHLAEKLEGFNMSFSLKESFYSLLYELDKEFSIKLSK